MVDQQPGSGPQGPGHGHQHDEGPGPADWLGMSLATIGTYQALQPLLTNAGELASALEAINRHDLAHQLLADCQQLARTMDRVSDTIPGVQAAADAVLGAGLED